MPTTYKKEVNFKCKLYRELYYSSQSAYGCSIVQTDDNIEHKKLGVVTIVGTYAQMETGIEYNVTAEVVNNEKFGYQYKVINMFCDNLTDANTMRNYLNAIIPKEKVDILLQYYPNLVTNILEDSTFEPDYELLPGIGKKSFDKIRDKIMDTYLLSEILALLSPIGVSFNMIKRIAESEKNVTLLKQKIMDNPYILTSIPMLSFIKVDAFALKLHPELRHSEFRMKSAVQYALQKMGEDNGNSWVAVTALKSELKKIAHEVLDLFDAFIAEEKEKTLKIEKEKPSRIEKDKLPLLYVDNHRCGLYRTYLMEKFIFNKLNDLNNTKNEIKIDDFDERIKKANKYLGFELDENQCETIKSVALRNVTFVSGKAGTGKSSIIKGILSAYSECSFNICALSAKASRRVVEVTGFRDAKTIHRLLEFHPAEGFLRNETNPLTCDYLILDEASMVNVYLFYCLLKAVPDKCKVIIVGDNMQLPPIGSGAIFTDILNSNYDFNILKLTKIYRQAEKSGIVVDANQIRDGIIPFTKLTPVIISGENKDMLYLFKKKREDIQTTIINLFMEYIKQDVSVKDVIVVLPRKDNCLNSTKEINEKIQTLLTKKTNAPFIQFGNKIFRLGDRILNTTNDYKKDVMNGEIGTITSINGNDMTIDFDGNVVNFTKEEMDGLELGYAMTVHKMQGSSAKYVIIGLDNTHKILLSSNLIYTAITRSEKKCLIVGETSAFAYGVRNTTENERNTFLPDFLKVS